MTFYKSDVVINVKNPPVDIEDGEDILDIENFI